MNKVAWMLERIVKDIKKYFPKIAKFVRIIVLFFGFGRMLSYYDRMEFYLPITMTILFIYGIYSWYSMGVGLGTEKDRGQTEGEKIMEMKRYEFIVTLANGTTVKTVESGRTPSEAQQIVESQHSDAKNVAYRGEV